MSHNNANFPPDSVSPRPLTVAERIEIELVAFAYKQAPLAQFTSLICATIVLVGLLGGKNQALVLYWYSFVVCITAARFLLVGCYMRFKNIERWNGVWQNLFILGAVLGGMCWGLTGSLLFTTLNSYQQTLVVLILAGTAAGAVPVLCAILWSSISFLLASLLPLILTLLYIRNDINFLFDFAVVIFTVYLIALSIKTHAMIRHSISLQFENNLLLNNLSDAKIELEEINEKLAQAATHDPLTHVANRNLFISHMEAAVDRSKKNKKMFALLYIDIDNFKMTNDVYGHHIGDQLLVILVDRMQNACKKMDIISRLGGDEFTIILENINDPYDVAKVAKRICQTITYPIELNTIEIKISASIGIAIYPNDNTDIEKLLNIADKTMYTVKEKGGNNYRFNIELLIE